MIKMLQCFFGILPLIGLLFAPSYAYHSSEEISINNNTKSLKASLVKNVMQDFYKKFPQKFPMRDRDIEEKFELVVDSNNAAQALALALITGGEAPQADALYSKYYDHGDTSIETEEDADKRADLIMGLQSEWSNFCGVLPEQKAFKKMPLDGIKREYFPGWWRLRPAYPNLTKAFYKKRQPVEVEQCVMDSIRPFAKRKMKWKKYLKKALRVQRTQEVRGLSN